MSTLDEMRAAAIDIAPPALAAIPIGLVFGAVAATKGLSPAEIALMSLTVFAGGAQFAAIEQWVRPVPVLALAFGTLLINLRHVLMGSSLMPKTASFAPWQRFLGFAIMADENWALAERRSARAQLTPTYWFTMAAIFYLNWQVWSITGSLIGPWMGPPERFGADFAFSALFIGLIAAFWHGRVTAAAVGASAVVSALVYVTAGAPWHVPLGAIAGVAAAWLAAPVPEEAMA